MRKLITSGRVIFWAGLIVIIYMFAILANETGKNYQLRSKADELEAQISRLESQIQDLGYKVTYYKTDSYRERLAREKLNVAAPGESVVIIKDDQAQKSENHMQKEAVLKSDEQIIAEKPNYQQWWIFLFGD
jgi:cell division protein FtsB